MHPDGEGSRATNDELNISISGPTPDYPGIAKAASGHKCWSGVAATADELARLLPEAVKAVQGGQCAVLEAQLEGPEGKFGGGRAVTVG